MMNKCSFSGNLLITPTFQNTASGEPVASLNISVDDGWLDGKKQAIYLKVLVKGDRAWEAVKHRKGDKVAVKGARYMVSEVPEKKLDSTKKSHFFVLDWRTGSLSFESATHAPEASTAQPHVAEITPGELIKPSDKEPAKYVSKFAKSESRAPNPEPEDDEEIPF